MQLTRKAFAKTFGDHALFGMVHLLPLPGAPLFGGSIDEVISAALRDARAIAKGGASGIVFENFGDRPFRKTNAGRETIASMTRVITEVTRELKLPFGVNVLRNDGLSALAIANATGASFIRVNILVGAMLTDQGIIEADAGELLRARGTSGPAIFADHLVKHATPLAAFDPKQLAKDLRLRALADAIIVSGAETGSPADPKRVVEVRSVVDAPIVIGSGLTSKNASTYAGIADGAIVGTSIKKNGDVGAPVDARRVAALVKAFR